MKMDGKIKLKMDGKITKKWLENNEKKVNCG